MKKTTKKRRISREVDRSPMNKTEREIAERIVQYYRKKTDSKK
ncbi:MAG TPA: hypothetical protein VEJ63_16345 [Planctomycetota bacterium]|nr:hypothetical protein [Planctomycetota bacterium]